MTTEAEALSLPPREAIAFQLGKVSVGTQRWDDVWQAGHNRAFMVAGVQAGDVLEGVRGAVQKAIDQGTTLAEFRRDLGPLMQRLGWEARGPGYVAWRTRLVYETNLRGAYAAGAYEQMSDPDVVDLVPFWRYRHSGARDARPEHQAWDGLVLRHDDAWWNSHYPPNGWGCGCWAESLTAADLARLGKAGPDAAPPIVRRPWRDPVSGRTDQVPIGIDPGWDYNVGAAWRSARDLPPSPVAPPADWVPPAPTLPAQPRPAAPPPLVPQPPAGPAPAPASPATAPTSPAAPAVPPAPAALPPIAGSLPVPRVSTEALWDFIAAPAVEPLLLAAPADAIRFALGTRAAGVLLSASTADKQRRHHPDLTRDDYAALPGMIEAPQLVLQQDGQRVLVLVRAGRIYVAAVKATEDGTEAYAVSFRRVSAKDLRRMIRRYAVVSGDPAALEAADDEGVARR